MTIKELEERTGMARANIRFYESEGLISPKRLENGYRDYSEEDAVTLEKIKLLRELHLDIDTIRLVQQGELTLEKALFSLLNRLEGEQAALGRAAEVCRELEKSGAEYRTLEPQPWLKRLDAPGQPELTGRSAPAAALPESHWWDGLDRACDHPWMRYFARVIDVGMYSAVVHATVFFLFKSQVLTELGTVLDWLFGAALLGVMFLLEPLWLHCWGWTPGKWVFGLKLRDKDGNKLSLQAALTRAGRVFREGYGYDIPIYNLWRLWKCYRCHDAGLDCPWDGEEGYIYVREERKGSAVLFLLAEAVYIGLVVLGLAYTYTPAHTGPLTTAEYCENVNHVLELYLDSDQRLDAQGNWVEADRSAGHVVIDLSGMEREVFYIEETDGVVTSVTVTGRGDGEIIYQSTAIYQAAVLAMEGAVRGGWPLNHGTLSNRLEDQWSDFETEEFGIRVVQTVEHSGYEGVGQILIGIDGESRHYTKTVTITLTGSD